MNDKLAGLITSLFLVIFTFNAALGQKKPSEMFGFEPGDDFKLAKYDLMLSYYQQLASSSDRVSYQEIGKSVLGKPLVLLAISSKQNIKQLDKYQKISREQAKATIPFKKAVENSINGKAVIWIDGGLHANERACAQMLPLLTYDLATSTDREIQKIREEVITLIMPNMNPDGLDIIADWYNKNLGTPYETTNPPYLYHHYVGHDNNRDWFMGNMPETKAVNRILYEKWFPQIVYNHHQTSPSWARIFVPPFASPVNPNIDPAIVSGTNLVGTAIANRLSLKNMPGVVSNYRFSMWWNGGMRTVPYFHNMIGILTETAHATPTPRKYPKRSLPKYIGSEIPSDGSAIFYSDPWKGGESRFKDAINYTYQSSLAVLSLAADRREKYLMDIFSLGKKNIENTDNLFGYLIPKIQRDEYEAIQLINILMAGGIQVEKTRSMSKINGKVYQTGSYFIPAAQAFFPYVKDLMEKQSYPIQRKFKGGPLKTPYDLAGWTLPMQMGVNFIKIKSKIALNLTELTSPEKPVMDIKGKGKHLMFPLSNESYKLVNYLQRNKVEVFYDNNQEMFYAKDFIKSTVDEPIMVFAERTNQIPENVTLLKKPKIGLYKSWVANMDEGWTRWILSEYGFDWDTLHNDDFTHKKLAKYDAIILPDQNEYEMIKGHLRGFMPDEFVGGLGLKGTIALDRFVELGGRVLAFDNATNYLINQLDLPVRNITKDISKNDFFIPGSLLGIDVYQCSLTYGMADEAIASFSRSSAFSIIKKIQKGEGGNELTVTKSSTPIHKVIARYAKRNILKSGYALNAEKYIGGKIAVLKVPKGKGDAILFGFRPQYRGQSHNTYKLIFNSFFFE